MTVALCGGSVYAAPMNNFDHLYCSKQLRGGAKCGLRPAHRGQHRGADTLTYCASCDRGIHVSSVAASHEDAGNFCFMCILEARREAGYA